MKSSPRSPSFGPNRTLHLLAGAVAIVLFGIGSSSCTSCHQVGVAASHSPGIVVEYDLPYDYMSGKYRQLYRTNPHWFHNHYEQGQVQGQLQTYYGTSMSK